MTSDLAPLPWRLFTGSGLAPWTLTVSHPKTGEVTLTSSEALDLCAAIELDRVHECDLVPLLSRRREKRERLTWTQLMAGADGLTRADAREGLTFAACLARVGLVIVREELVSEAKARDAAALGQAKEWVRSQAPRAQRRTGT